MSRRDVTAQHRATVPAQPGFFMLRIEGMAPDDPEPVHVERLPVVAWLVTVWGDASTSPESDPFTSVEPLTPGGTVAMAGAEGEFVWALLHPEGRVTDGLQSGYEEAASLLEYEDKLQRSKSTRQQQAAAGRRPSLPDQSPS